MVEDLVAVFRAFGLFERDAACCGDVTVPQCIALQELLGGTRDVGSMAAVLGLTLSGATRLLDGLEERDLVERARGAEDRRRVEVRLTAAGRTEAKRLRVLTAKLIEMVLNRVPARERSKVVEAVRLLRAAVDECRDDVQRMLGRDG
jgi:DNA-binding MarR family transcriptional regulator